MVSDLFAAYRTGKAAEGKASDEALRSVVRSSNHLTTLRPSPHCNEGMLSKRTGRNCRLAMQTSEIVPCLDRVQRIVAVDISYTISRMKVLERLPGNPIEIGYRWVDETAVALRSRLPSFTRVIGLRAGQESQIQPLVPTICRLPFRAVNRTS